MEISDNIIKWAHQALKELYKVEDTELKLVVNETRKDFDGDYTLVVFPLTKYSKSSPQQTAEDLGAYIVERSEIFSAYNVVKGFLNLSLSDASWSQILAHLRTAGLEINLADADETVMVEFSSPNTNKPLHLGHVRNILLGWSTTKIFEACGYNVVKTQIANDRGIAICKSMLAWKLFADGATPASTGTKGDHFVGEYYVLFERKLREEYTTWQSTDAAQSLLEQSTDSSDPESFFKSYKNKYFNEYSELGAKAKSYLQRWEAGDEEVVALWKQLNSWVYSGFDETYDSLGVDFDKIYYESNTYLRGKEFVKTGLDNGIFYQKEDQSVWVDLEDAGLDQKIVLRSDGTSVYITQDLGTAELRYQDYQAKRMIYVVANEQDYHFKVLFEIMKKLGAPYADGLYHLSYGMVELPSGRMKTREGTVVDADDLLLEMREQVVSNAVEKGGLEDLDQESMDQVYDQITLGALKFFMLKVAAKKNMVFDPAESVDLQGHTGPYVQNASVRISSILRKYGDKARADWSRHVPIDAGKELIKLMLSWQDVLHAACKSYDPSQVANFSYQLAKSFHKYYHDAPILRAEPEVQAFRLELITQVQKYLKYSFDLLGISIPERM